MTVVAQPTIWSLLLVIRFTLHDHLSRFVDRDRFRVHRAGERGEVGEVALRMIQKPARFAGTICNSSGSPTPI